MFRDLFPSIANIWEFIAEIAILFVFLYALLSLIHGSRGLGILRALVFAVPLCFVVVYVIVKELQLERLGFLLAQLTSVSLFAFIIIFQPELRRGLIRLGHSRMFRAFMRGHARVIAEIAKTSNTLARNKIGALIAIERQDSLSSYFEHSTRLDAEITSELLGSIFWPGSPLHDGAVIIRNLRIAGAGCLLPLSENAEISKSFGTRHRAALGLSEETDAVCVVVSEETGRIALAEAGHLAEDLSPQDLKDMLNELLVPQELENGSRVAKTS